MSSSPNIVREIRIVDGISWPHGKYRTGDKCIQIRREKVTDCFQASGVEGSAS
jgi:hypothetical protein